MISLFWQMVLGHLVGDFLVQPKWMAIRKSERGWKGAAICTVHVLIYTLSVALFTGIWNGLFLLTVAVPHWIVDRHSLAAMYMESMHSRTIKTVNTQDPWDAPFTAIMYTVNDMTIHLLFLYGALKLL